MGREMLVMLPVGLAGDGERSMEEDGRIWDMYHLWIGLSHNFVGLS